MADEITTPIPNPAAKAGNQTSEWFLTKVIVWIATATGLLGSALATVQQFSALIPAGSWIFTAMAIGGGAVAFGTSAVYTLSRARVKIAAMENGAVPDLTPQQVADLLGAAKPDQPAIPPPPATPAPTAFRKP